ncbi:MAG: peptidoglycan-binding domain-containing protein [Candidatus Paceibacterota bacterium]|jgi:peptidoglycan hydrolase-like protein with peptidoglycan-binding domain
MKTNHKILLTAIFVFAAAGLSVSASQNPNISASSTTSIASLIVQLRQKIAELSSQIDQLKNSDAVKDAKQDIKAFSLQIKNQLKQGVSSEDVRLLQEFLASDPEIYPEGKITGYFGQATKKAVQRFQRKFCISAVGNVGPQTMQKINELLAEGAGNSGKVPEGLLKAPGILKKLCENSTSTSSSTPNVTKIIDATAPVISVISAAEIGTSTAKITWKTDDWSDGKVYYSQLTPIDISATSTLSASADGLFKLHNVNLADLTSGTTTYYFVSSKNDSGNISTSSESSFETLP